ncbi:hypothetical protein BJX63DRAFT_56439 [Aspergillus granulosus]|uniref:Uncharacterized protein n=1 Tax=Aspergillus granulosus TaxID=176169 RepID=A0ABR4GXD7_9EURO
MVTSKMIRRFEVAGLIFSRYVFPLSFCAMISDIYRVYIYYLPCLGRNKGYCNLLVPSGDMY